MKYREDVYTSINFNEYYNFVSFSCNTHIVLEAFMLKSLLTFVKINNM